MIRLFGTAWLWVSFSSSEYIPFFYSFILCFIYQFGSFPSHLKEQNKAEFLSSFLTGWKFHHVSPIFVLGCFEIENIFSKSLLLFPSPDTTLRTLGSGQMLWCLVWVEKQFFIILGQFVYNDKIPWLKIKTQKKWDQKIKKEVFRYSSPEQELFLFLVLSGTEKLFFSRKMSLVLFHSRISQKVVASSDSEFKLLFLKYSHRNKSNGLTGWTICK